MGTISSIAITALLLCAGVAHAAPSTSRTRPPSRPSPSSLTLSASASRPSRLTSETAAPPFVSRIGSPNGLATTIVVGVPGSLVGVDDPMPHSFASSHHHLPLLWKVFAGNAVVLLVATLTLVLSPATVSFPVALEELVVLAGGLALMLAMDVALLRRAFRPLTALAAFARGVDPLAPGRRAQLGAADPEVRDVAEAVDEMLDRIEARAA